MAKAELGEKTEVNKEYFEFIEDSLQGIAIIEKEEADKKKAILESYLGAYKTVEEKIAAINAETDKLIKIADDEVTKNKLDNTRKQRIAEVKFGEAKQEIDDKIAEYGE